MLKFRSGFGDGAHASRWDGSAAFAWYIWLACMYISAIRFHGRTWASMQTVVFLGRTPKCWVHSAGRCRSAGPSAYILAGTLCGARLVHCHGVLGHTEALGDLRCNLNCERAWFPSKL